MAVTIDFETYYDKDYSLSKLTTEQYIRDPRFEIIGVAVKKDAEPTVWYSFDSVDQYKETLAPLADEVVISHNALFDMSIMSWILDIRPNKLIADTLSMARPHHGSNVGGSLKALAEHYQIGVKGTEVINALGKHRADFTEDELNAYAEYCKNDVDLTYELFKILVVKTTKTELQLIDRTLRMHTEPVLELDTKALKAHLEVVKEKRREALREVVAAHPDIVADAFISGDSLEEAARATLASNPKLAEVLRSLGVEPPMKVSLANGSQTYAFSKTDKAFQALLEHEDPKVQAVVSARLNTKSSIEETRTEAFIGLASRGPMPVPLSYCGATTTWRWSGMDKINLQNLPRGGALRHAIKAPKGFKLVACDSSNIELRVNHTLAGQAETVAALRNGDDLYCQFASAVFGRPITKADKTERMLGKVSQLGLGYGMGHAKFLETARIQSKGEILLDEAESKRIVNLWRDTYDAVPRLWKQGEAALSAIANFEVMTIGNGGLVSTTKTGLVTKPDNFILYPNLRRSEGAWVYDAKVGRTIVPNKIYGGKVVENCLSADTEVLTDKGWKPIICLHVNDLVWDGEEFVPHKGVKYMGEQEVINFGGVLITPEHKVLIDDKFIEARKTTHRQATSSFSKSYRVPFRNARSCWVRWKQWAKKLVGCSV